MSILGNLRIMKEDTTYLLFSAPADKDVAFTLNIANTDIFPADVKVMLAKKVYAELVEILPINPGRFTSIPNIIIEDEGAIDSIASVATMKVVDFELLSAGASYTVGDVLTLSNQAGTGTSATFKVLTTTESGGLLTLGLLNPGSYTAIVNKVSLSLSGGTGNRGSVGFVVFGIESILVEDAGKGYTKNPVVTTSINDTAELQACLAATMSPSTVIEPRITISKNAVYERSGLVLSAGESILVSSSAADAVNVHAWGFLG